METLEKEIVDAVLVLHVLRAVPALSYSPSEAVRILSENSEAIKKHHKIDITKAIELIPEHPEVYAAKVMEITEYKRQVHDRFATTRCLPGDLLDNREKVYRFIRTGVIETDYPKAQTSELSSQSRSPTPP